MAKMASLVIKLMSFSTNKNVQFLYSPLEIILKATTPFKLKRRDFTAPNMCKLKKVSHQAFNSTTKFLKTLTYSWGFPLKISRSVTKHGY